MQAGDGIVKVVKAGGQQLKEATLRAETRGVDKALPLIDGDLDHAGCRPCDWDVDGDADQFDVDGESRIRAAIQSSRDGDGTSPHSLQIVRDAGDDDCGGRNPIFLSSADALRLVSSYSMKGSRAIRQFDEDFEW